MNNSDQQQQSLATVETDRLTTAIIADLTPTQLAQATQFARSLVLRQQSSVLSYGKSEQTQMAQFSDEILAKVSHQSLGEIGTSLRLLATHLQTADPEKIAVPHVSLLARLFSRVKVSVFEMTAKYQAISVQIDRVAQRLDQQESQLLHENDLLDDMYQENNQFYQMLNVLIAGAALKMQALTSETAKLKKAATAEQMLGQQLQDLLAFNDQIGKRLLDLLLTREITIQQAPQIRLIQNNNTLLAEKIQASITTAIPLWKNQVVVALAMIEQRQALTTQNAVTDATNTLLKKNSELVKQATIDVAQASQRGVVDVETLKITQANLIQAITEALAIQADGRAQRQTITTQLKALEDDLRQQLTTDPHVPQQKKGV